jgi:hypothetical protein
MDWCQMTERAIVSPKELYEPWNFNETIDNHRLRESSSVTMIIIRDDNHRPRR